LGRELQALGHLVRLIQPSYVKAYLKRSKNGANDAAAICEAVTRPSMRFVPIKTKEQQTGLAAQHRQQGDGRIITAALVNCGFATLGNQI
jgi:transposase